MQESLSRNLYHKFHFHSNKLHGIHVRGDTKAAGNAGWTVTDNILWHPQPETNFTQGGAQRFNSWQWMAFINDGGRDANFSNNIVMDR